jgi:allantoicase
MKRTDLDLASRALGGSVRYVSDEFFAACEALLMPGPPVHDTSTFGPHGKIYDGWETRRRRTPGYDWAVVALGVPGVLHEIVVDTSFFLGNYPPEVSVEATWVDGSPDRATLERAEWITVVPNAAARGNMANTYRVYNNQAFTHVRLNIYPDGGVARLRVHGSAVPDPRTLGDRIDLAAIHHGGDIAECSDMFYSDARHVLYPGIAKSMADGWETARRRTAGNDYLVVTLAGPARLSFVTLDTGYFLGNAPGRVRISARSADNDPWREILAERLVSPDSRNRFRLQDDEEVTAVRVDVYPDGGFSRLHLMGQLSPDALATAISQWLTRLPAQASTRVLLDAGLGGIGVRELTEKQLLSLAW